MEVEKIYFDMDGVLADFERGVKEICGLTPPSQNAKHHKPGEDDEMWKAIKACPHFYDYLELMPGAKEKEENNALTKEQKQIEKKLKKLNHMKYGDKKISRII